MNNPAPDKQVPDQSPDHLDFRALFIDADAHFTRSAELNDLCESFASVLVTSAIAKCLDFNNQANCDATAETAPSFFLIANTRAMCEELIYCALFKQLGQQRSALLAVKLNRLACLSNIIAQTRFFASNNKLQPTLGGFTDSDELTRSVEQVSEELNDLWEQCGFTSKQKKPTRTISSISKKVGLETMYKYTYYLTSSFVHFNSGQLLKTGWGPENEPFRFSVGNFKGYFSDLARFLGAIVFLGYCYLAPEAFEEDLAAKYAHTIHSQLQGNFRWPEITTYEEMNQTWPDNVLIRVAMTVERSENPMAMPNLLSELKGLAS